MKTKMEKEEAVMLRDMHKDMVRMEKDQEVSRIRTDHLYETLCNILAEKKRI